MWCVSKPSGERSFYSSEDLAIESASSDTAAVVWFDSFDYATHNPGDERAAWFGPLVAEHRAAGLAYIAALTDELRARWIDPWGVAPA